MSDKVNLFLVGAAKAGTTTLFRYLQSHPEIFIPDEKEPHYFSTDLHEESDKYHNSLNQGLKFPFRYSESYYSLYSKAEGNKIIGDASTSYLISRVAAKNIYQYNPNARILIILRNPVESVFSYYTWLRNRQEEYLSFQKAWKLQGLRVNEWKDLSPYVRFPSRVHYKEVFNYIAQIERYKNTFPAKNIKIVLSDYMFDNPLKVYKEVLSFLGCGYIEPRNFLQENVTQESKVGNALRLKLLAIKKASFPSFKFNRQVLYWFEKIFTRNKKIKLDYNTRDQLNRYYYPMIVELSEMLEENLVEKWGYSYIEKNN